MSKSYIVDQSFRTNPKSHVEGGSNVMVRYHSGEERIYTNIKNVNSYCKVALKNPLVKECQVLKSNTNE
jgi:hypothetical protein